MSDAPAREQHSFKAEVQKLLHIITHSIYTNKEIFLRELVSNASDALDKLRFETSRSTVVADPELPLEIRITADKDAKLLVIEDAGVGMTRDELVENIGTIAKSGSEEFLRNIEQARAEGQAEGKSAEGADAGGIIGRFGVGFYSVFMVADKVRIETRSFRPEAGAVLWESDGLGAYEIEDLGKERPRGTRIEITLKADASEYLEKNRLERILKTHSNFIGFPILLEGGKINTIPALWREPKFQITAEQYEEFYKFLTYDSKAPLETIHVAVDAPVQFTSLCFVPSFGMDPFGLGRDEYGLDLYVRRVLIQRRNKDLVPEYLGFLKGVVDTEDLPLNISRETLQENALIRKINQTLAKQVLSHLEKMARERGEAYEEFWRAHGRTFRLGYADYANREKFAGLLRFNSSQHEDAKGLTSLDDYIARAKPDQKKIYYIAGAGREAVNLNPHLEIFRDKGVEVLYLYEALDELALETLREYKDFSFASAELADMAALEAMPSQTEKKDKPEELDEGGKKTFTELLARIKEILGDKVTEVRASQRLSDSPCCLVSPEGGLSSSMQKVMQLMHKDASIPPKVMEVNRDHPLVRNLLRIFRNDPQDDMLRTSVEQLYESSLLLEGYLSDPHAMVQRINTLLQRSSGWYAEIKDI